MSIYENVALSATEAWLDGEFVGGSDCVAELDQRSIDRNRESGAGRTVPKTTNPHPKGTLEYSEWGNGYYHGWHQTLDHEQRSDR